MEAEHTETTKENMDNIMMMTTKKTKIHYADNLEETMKEKGVPHNLGRWIYTITDEPNIPQYDLKDYNEIYELRGCQSRRDFCEAYLHCDVFHLTDSS